MNKTIGYELRCATPLPMEAEYARDLGFAAVRRLIGHGGGVMVTTQAGVPRFVPLIDCIDPATGRGRQRAVDVASESYEVARAYMVRLQKADFADEEMVTNLARSGGFGVDEFRRHFSQLDLR
jgi:ATP-dependent phosphofructokinase / diphosphate-dependent phosphofructokinase